MINEFKRPNTLAAVFIRRPSDKVLFQEFFERHNGYTKKELVDAYNKVKQIFGVHAQLVYLVAMHEAFLNKFEKSPFVNEEGDFIALGPKIHYSEQTDVYVYLS